MCKTYRDLRNALGRLSEEQLENDLTIYSRDEDEYYRARIDIEVPETDVLDPGHPVLVIQENA